MLKQNVNIVFHSAATVRFDQSIKEAVNLNTLGSIRLWELCAQMENLRSIIHVSTAYTNPTRECVGEQVYPSQAAMDLNTFIKCAEALPEDLVVSIATHLQVWKLICLQFQCSIVVINRFWNFWIVIAGKTSEYVHNHQINGWTNGNRISSQIAHNNCSAIDSHVLVGRTISGMGGQCQWNHWHHNGNWPWHIEQHHVRQSADPRRHTSWHCMQYDDNSRLAQLL